MEYIKNSYNSTVSRQTNLKIGKTIQWIFYQRRRMTDKHMKRWSTSLFIRGCKPNPQWNTTIYQLDGCYQRQTIPNVGKDMEKLGHLYISGENWFRHSGERIGSCLNIKHKQPSNSTPRNLSKRDENICSHKDLYTNAHSSIIIHNSQKNGNNPNVHT